MADTFPVESPAQPQPERGRYRIAWMGAATIVIAIVIVVWPGSERPAGSSPREAHLPFGSAEQAYASNIQVRDLTLSRAENFLNQEVTTLSGKLTNAGALPIADVELTVEFSDEFGQVVLRESRDVFSHKASQIEAGEQRDFEVSFEHIPPSWNIQQPEIRVSGILFSQKKE